MKLIKKNYKIILIFFIAIFILNIRFPYYIDTPGGIENIENQIKISKENVVKSKGSFNIVYVKEYKATIPTLFMSLFSKNFDIIKQEKVMLDNEDYSMYLKRDRIMMDESISNSIYVAYTKANKDIKINNSKIVVAYIDNQNSNLKINDEIIKIENNDINSQEDITNVLKKFNVGDKINLLVKNNNKEYKRYAYIKEEEGTKKLGIIICNINEYDVNPKINIKIDKDESGPSGGFMTALYIYNLLTKNDITKGMKIVGTGTINIDGSVGQIGGIKYKLVSAVKSKADLFFVPKDNYNEALILKQERNYKIKIVSVKTIDDAIDYLNSNIN